MRPSVYIMSNPSHSTLYIGVTSDLETRVSQHKSGSFPGSFSRRYNTHCLVYCEEAPDMEAAIAREKQLKRWSRAKKMALIETFNPEWRDLAAD